jgi:hypothetical protein
MPHSPPAGRTPACLFTSQVYPYLAGPAHYRRPAPRDAEPPERTGVVRTQDAALEPEAHGSTPADAHGSTPADPPPPAVIDTAGRVEQRLRHPLQRYDRPKADEAGRRIEYGATAGEPDRLLRWWQRRAPAAEADADRPAERTEHVVSVRNEGWTAKWIAD